MTRKTGRNRGRCLLWSTLAAGVSVLAVGCTTVPDIVSRPIHTMQQFPAKLVGNDDDAKLRKQTENDPFPTPSEAAAKVAMKVQ